MFNMFYVACNVLYIYTVLCFVEKYYSSKINTELFFKLSLFLLVLTLTVFLIHSFISTAIKSSDAYFDRKPLVEVDWNIDCPAQYRDMIKQRQYLAMKWCMSACLAICACVCALHVWVSEQGKKGIMSVYTGKHAVLFIPCCLSQYCVMLCKMLCKYAQLYTTFTVFYLPGCCLWVITLNVTEIIACAKVHPLNCRCVVVS